MMIIFLGTGNEFPSHNTSHLYALQGRKKIACIKPVEITWLFTFRLPFFCLEELYDEVSALLNETYQKLIAPPEETPSVSDDSVTSWYSRQSSLFQALR